MRLIDADALDMAYTRLRFFNGEAKLRHWGDRDEWVLKGTEVDELISNTPTVDAVPVVRCKDCKHGELLFTYDDGTEWYLCRTHSLVDLPSNWFCKGGERKDE